MTHSSGTWDDAKVHRLMALRGKGFSAMEIGKALGVSRNAVIGKLTRLGFALKGRRSVKARSARRKLPDTRKNRPEPSMPKVTVAAAAKREPDTEPHIDPEPIPDPEPATEAAAGARGAAAAVMALGPRSCRWPMGDPKDPDFRFCGVRRKRGAYCEAHAAAAEGTVHAAPSVPQGKRRNAPKKGALFFRSHGQ